MQEKKNFYIDSPLRSIVKSIMWRLLGSVITFAISYTITTKVYVSSIIVVTDMVIKFFVYYLHERVWSKINFGLHKT